MGVSAIIADSRGKILTEAEVNRWSNREDDTPDQPAPKNDPKDKIKFELSPISKEFKAFSNPWDKDEKAPKPSPENLNLFYQPEVRDPLSYGCSEAMIAYAKYYKKNLVVAAPDWAVFLESPDQLKRFKGTTLEYAGLSLVEDPKWIIFGATNPLKQARGKYDRNDLGLVMRTYRQKAKLAIEDEAALALALPDDEDEYRPMNRLLESSKGVSRLIYNEPKMLKLYAKLSRQERTSAAQSAKGIPLSRLNEAAQKQIFDLVYYGERWMLNYNPQMSDNGQPGVWNQDAYDSYYNGLMREPTVSMPNGLPRNATIKLTETASEVLRTGPMQRQGYMDDGRFIDVEELAWTIFMRTRPDLYPWADNEYYEVNTNDLSMYKQRIITIEVNFGNGLTMNRSLTEAEPKGTGKYTLETLPKELKDKYAKRWKELVEQAKNDQGGYSRGGGGEQLIPPRPNLK